MVDVLLAVAFIALPIAAWLVSRRLTPLVIALVFGFGIAGNIAQTTIALGWPWHVRTLQITTLVVMLGVLGWAVWSRSRGGSRGDLRRAFVVVVVPVLVLGVFLIAMRLMADGAGPMSAVGYFINHPLAEDNAKWLHLSAQLADGREISFNGYAGGPLLLLMSVMAALMSVLSMVLLGGVNEVAVAANTVLATQFLLIALVPFAFAPLARRKLNLPAPLVWAGMLVLALASAVITSYGHLSLQFVLPILVAWILVFVTGCPPRQRLLMTLAIVTLASVWLPLNVLGIALLFGALVYSIVARRWVELAVVVVTAVVTWDALFSSAAYLLGWDVGVNALVDALPFIGEAGEGAPAVAQSSVHLFEAPGGTEIVGPLLGGLAVMAVLATVWLLRGRGATERGVVLRLAPVVVLTAYTLAVVGADAISTGRAPNYGANKLSFTLVIAVLAALLPLALTVFDNGVSGMTILRWFAVGGVVVLLSADTLLPRALSALSPVLWPAVNAQNPQYWSIAEVRTQGEQPLTSLPVACLFTPQGASPTALPLGQESYACTRLLVGLSGLEGRTGLLPAVIQDDWLSNRSTWPDRVAAVRETSNAILDRSVIVMTPEGGVSGITTVGQLLSRP